MVGKDFFLSKTNWGILLTFFFVGLNQLGVETPDPNLVAQDVVEFITASLTYASGLLAIYGRWSAEGPITSVLGVKVKE